MSSTCFEPEGSSSGRRTCIQVWYSVFYLHQYKQSYGYMSVFEPEGSSSGRSSWRCTLEFETRRRFKKIPFKILI